MIVQGRAMRKVGLIFTTGVLALWLGACGSQTTEEEATSIPSPDASATEQPAAQSPQGEPTPKPFENPLVAQQQQGNTAAEAGLIQSTKPEERLLQLKGGTGTGGAGGNVATNSNQPIEDPFAPPKPEFIEIPTDPTLATESSDLAARQIPDLPELPVATPPRPWATVAIAPTQSPQFTTPFGGAGVVGTSQSGTSPRQGTTQGRSAQSGTSPRQGTTQGGASQSGTPGRTARTPRKGPPQLPSLPIAAVPDLPELPPGIAPTAWLDPNPPPIAVLPSVPPPPRTDLAEAIEVTGVVQPEGRVAKVILKAPTEPTSRYVSVGDRIAGGQVLVKRVKFVEGSDPVVIFEQNGVEIAVSVGEVRQPPAGLNLVVPREPVINARNVAF
ncbi:MAG: hypothetical protein ACRC8A_06000 [Microcoleaceae cyanobacterium]